MKILLANSLYAPNVVGGAERVVQTLAETLTGKGHEVVVVTTQPSGTEQVATVNGVQVRYVPPLNVYRPFSGAAPTGASKAFWHTMDTFNPLMGRAFGSILDQEKPELVNTHNLAGFSVSVMAAAKSRGLPLVHTLHDQYLLCPRATMFKNMDNCREPCGTCRLYALPRRRVSQRVDVVVGVSRYILERHTVHGYFRAGERRVIYNGLPSVEASAARTVRERPFRFGFMGQIRATKGLHLLVEAFLSECATEAQLWIAGRGDEGYELELRRRTGDSGAVRWLGFVRPEQLLEEIDVLVVPSVWADTAPLVVLEAARRGVAVLGSNRGGIPELIPPDIGWIFDPVDVAALRQALRRCLESAPALATMAEAARRHARSFGLEGFVGGYLEAFQAAMDRSPGKLWAGG